MARIEMTDQRVSQLRGVAREWLRLVGLGSATLAAEAWRDIELLLPVAVARRLEEGGPTAVRRLVDGDATATRAELSRLMQ